MDDDALANVLLCKLNIC